MELFILLSMVANVLALLSSCILTISFPSDDDWDED